MNKPFYITTAIDYPNGSPHLGHMYEKIVTDTYARWYKFLGQETYFLTGTDENGQKLTESAKAAGIPTQKFVDDNVAVFKNFCHDIDILNDDFIRTTEKRHADVAREIWLSLEKDGHIYAGKYSGKYCISCESFYTALQAPDDKCPSHHSPLTLKEEEGLFFKLSVFHDWLLDHLKAHPDFITPRSKYNEIISRLEGDDLRDLAITRPNEGWGIPVPGHDQYVMYTWFDALINYYSAIKAERPQCWPCDVHVIGKDILWFHAVIWPCILKGAGIDLPKQIYVHGMILADDGKKMSKSLANTVNPQDLLKKYPIDSIRYYLLRAMPANNDGRFSEQELINRHNCELGNDFGNLIMRVLKLSLKVIPAEIAGQGIAQDFDFTNCLSQMKEYMDKREHDHALNVLWSEVQKVNHYINEKAPWSLKDQPEIFRHVIYNCLYAIHSIAGLLSPFMPKIAPLALSPLGVKIKEGAPPKFSDSIYQLSVPEPLFPRIGE